jgi:hypothetical protein
MGSLAEGDIRGSSGRALAGFMAEKPLLRLSPQPISLGKSALYLGIEPRWGGHNLSVGN